VEFWNLSQVPDNSVVHTSRLLFPVSQGKGYLVASLTYQAEASGSAKVHLHAYSCYSYLSSRSDATLYVKITRRVLAIHHSAIQVFVCLLDTFHFRFSSCCKKLMYALKWRQPGMKERRTPILSTYPGFLEFIRKLNWWQLEVNSRDIFSVLTHFWFVDLIDIFLLNWRLW
jgi:hypothetical protein